MVICIETSTPVCSVALCDREEITGLRESHEGRSHSALLTLFIRDLLDEAGKVAEDLEAVAVSKGPGSYTGLRIGVSVAKGIAYAASVPLIGVGTLHSMFHGIISGAEKNYPFGDDTLFCPMIDARRMEVYSAVYDFRGNIVREITAEVIGEDSFSHIPDNQTIVFFGDGASKCRKVIKRNNVFFADDFRISAAYMQKLAYMAIKDKEYEDLAYFEPYYLKDFIATKSLKNVSGR